jgi:hypothetical protein
VGLLALCLLPLFYPLVDVTNWQRLAATRKDMSSSGVEPGQRSAVLRGVFRIYAVESSLVWLFMCMLGAIAVIAIETPGGADVLQGFIAQLISESNEVTAVALPLLLICVAAVALSTMSALFSASLCTIRYDMLAAFDRPVAGTWHASAEQGQCDAACAGGVFASRSRYFAPPRHSFRFPRRTFLAVVRALLCAGLICAARTGTDRRPGVVAPAP